MHFLDFSHTKIHRFTDSHICVSWKNLHNNIIIFILYIYYEEKMKIQICVNL